MSNSRFAFSTGALFPYDSADALRLVKEAGFDCAELMPQALSDASEEATRAFEKTGIRITSIHFPLVFFGMFYTAIPSMQADSRKFSRDLLTMGSRMGTKVMVVHPHEAPKMQGYFEKLEQPMIDNLRWLAEECDRFGITLAMENSPKTCATAPMLRDYIAMLNTPNILPMVDTTEVCEAGGDPVEFLRALKPCHLHMSDFTDSTKHLPAGQGSIDWAGVKAALQAWDYQGMYTLEPTYRFYLEDVPARLRDAYRFLEENFSD